MGNEVFDNVSLYMWEFMEDFKYPTIGFEDLSDYILNDIEEQIEKRVLKLNKQRPLPLEKAMREVAYYEMMSELHEEMQCRSFDAEYAFHMSAGAGSYNMSDYEIGEAYVEMHARGINDPDLEPEPETPVKFNLQALIDKAYSLDKDWGFPIPAEEQQKDFLVKKYHSYRDQAIQNRVR